MIAQRPLLFTVLMFFVGGGMSSCSSGCVKCTGITADQIHCKGDYQEAADYSIFVQQYEEQGGVCEDI